MQIWVDADACPKVIKDILFRAAERTGVSVTLVANRPIAPPRFNNVKAIRVRAGFDEADREIVNLAQPGDLVITADIPLAADVVEKGCQALDPRGEQYTAESIPERLATRNLMDQLRSEGLETGGPPAFGTANRQSFANALDRWLARRPKPGAD